MCPLNINDKQLDSSSPICLQHHCHQPSKSGKAACVINHSAVWESQEFSSGGEVVTLQVVGIFGRGTGVNEQSHTGNYVKAQEVSPQALKDSYCCTGLGILYM